MHSDGHDWILSRRRLSNTHFLSNVLFDQPFFICWNELKITSTRKDSQHLWVQLPGKVDPALEGVSHKEKVQSNLERIIVFVAWKIIGNFFIKFSSKNMILDQSWLRSLCTFTTRLCLMQQMKSCKNSNHFTFPKESLFHGRSVWVWHSFQSMNQLWAFCSSK